MRQKKRHIGLGFLKIGKLEKRYVNEALSSNRLSTGPFIQAFEREFAREHESEFAIMCNSGTSALHLAVAALKEIENWKDGDEVLVPAVTFIATSNVVLHNNLKPVFVDVHPAYYNIDPDKIKERITGRTRAIIPAHLFGLPCEMAAILELAGQFGLKIIEDSCETMFARTKGRSVGAFGAMACFSTYVAHILVTGVGGLITTSRPDYAMHCRSLLAHGRDAIYLSIDDDDGEQDENRRRQIIERRFSFVRLGHSFRATELEGALGLAQIKKKDAIISRRRENARHLSSHLKKFGDRLQLPAAPSYSDHSFMMYPLLAKDGVNREDLVDYLEARGIETRYMLPLINQPIYKKIFGELEDQYPAAKTINARGFYIGCHQGLTKADLDYVVESFDAFFSMTGAGQKKLSRAGGKLCAY